MSAPADGVPAIYAGRARLPDVPELAKLESRSQVHPWTQAMLAGELEAAPPGGILVLLRAPAGEAVAYVAFRVVADELHVHNLVVAPELRGRGLGRWLLRLALGLGARAGARTAELEVRAGNGPARALYLAEGFAQVGERRRYYSSPVEDAVVLRRILEPRGSRVVTSPGSRRRLQTPLHSTQKPGAPRSSRSSRGGSHDP